MQKHDPKGLRTMICVTKIDLRTSGGYESYRKAAAKFNKHRLFFTRNKTDEERTSKMKSEHAREAERKFIEGHRELSRFTDEQKGVVALRNYLVNYKRRI